MRQSVILVMSGIARLFVWLVMCGTVIFYVIYIPFIISLQFWYISLLIFTYFSSFFTPSLNFYFFSHFSFLHFSSFFIPSYTFHHFSLTLHVWILLVSFFFNYFSSFFVHFPNFPSFLFSFKKNVSVYIFVYLAVLKKGPSNLNLQSNSKPNQNTLC